MIVEYPRANWSAAIETGLPAIDSQHKQLFDLAASFRGEGDQIRIMRSLAMLSDYAHTHLTDEEAMLEEIGYAKLPEHRVQHENFRTMLRLLIADSRKLTLDQIADRIEALINGWFYQHILTVDVEYVAAARAHQGASSSAADSTP